MEQSEQVRKLIAIYRPKAREGMSPRQMHKELQAVELPKPLTQYERELVVYQSYHPFAIHTRDHFRKDLPRLT